MTTETTRPEADPGRPFDYRREMLVTMKSELDWNLKQNDDLQRVPGYLSLASAMQILDLPIRPMSSAFQDAVSNHVNEELSTWNPDMSPFPYTTTIQNLARVDKSFLTRHPKFPDMLASLKKYADARESALSVNAQLLFLGSPSRAGFSTSQLRPLTSVKLSDLETDSHVINFLEELADARICGALPAVLLDTVDWTRVRTIFNRSLSMKLFSKAAEVAAYSRIINANEIRFDENGMHIIDPDRSHAPPQTSNAPIPPRKNI